jgi:hypothetical protein
MSFVLVYDQAKGNVPVDYVTAKISHQFLQGPKKIGGVIVSLKGQISNLGSLHMFFTFKRNNGGSGKIDDKAIDQIIQNIAGDSLGFNLNLWGESERNLYEYISTLTHGMIEESIRS